MKKNHIQVGSKSKRNGRTSQAPKRARAGGGAGQGNVTLRFHEPDGSGVFACDVPGELYDAIERASAVQGVSLQTFVTEAVREHVTQSRNRKVRSPVVEGRPS